MNTSQEETEAVFVIVSEYGTMKSFAIRLKGVQFPKMTQNTNVSLISKFNLSSSIWSRIVTYTLMKSSEYVNVSELNYTTYQQFEIYI